MKKSILTLVFVFLFLFSYSQCDNPISKTINYKNGTSQEVEYCGATDDNNVPKGQGTMTYKNPEYPIDFIEGNWVDGALNGVGKVVYRDGDIYEGIYEGGFIIKGTRVWKKEGLEYVGSFKDTNFHGENGVYTQKSDNKIRISIGQFKNGLLVEGEIMIETDLITKTQTGSFFNKVLDDGEEIINEKKSGVIIITKYEDGDGTVVYRNDQNSYNPADIIGGDTFSVVKLDRKGSVSDARLAYNISLEIDGLKGDFVLDTGAMTFKIGKKMFERLKTQGIEFVDLNKKVISRGVGGISNGKTVILNNVKIGDYVLNNVVATVSLDSNFSLLGTGFLLKFSNVKWDMKEETLTIFK